MNVLDLLANDNYLIVNRDMVKLLGLRQAVMFGELCSEQNYWNKQAGEDGQWFYSTQENIEDKIGLSPYEQREALKVLEEKGLIERQKKGIPCKTYYRVCLEQVVKIFDNWTSKPLTTGSEENSQLNNNKQDKTKENKITYEDVRKKQEANTMIDNLIYHHTENAKLRETLHTFLEYRNKKRSPMTELAVRMMLKKLAPFTEEEQIDAIETSIVSNWEGVFPKHKVYGQNEQKSVGKVAHKSSEYDEGFDENGNFIY
jgi:DNA-binding Lrp family transcriptional regulator